MPNAGKRTLKNTVAAYSTQIEQNNQAFEKMSKAEQRVAIARDVLKQIAIGRFHARRGMYTDVHLKVDGKTLNAEDQVQDALTEVKSCNVCALGALFISGVGQGGDLQIKNLGFYSQFLPYNGVLLTGSDARNYLCRFFDRDELGVIENMFERQSNDEWARIGDDSERLRLIMEHIVANKGNIVYCTSGRT